MFSYFFIQRPKFAIVISILMMLAGMLCITKMPISEYPEVAPPSVDVSATYPGASAQELAEVVAPLIEQQMTGLDDLEYYSSSCTNDGSYSLKLIFKSGTDSDMAMINVSNAIKRVEPKLPSEITKNGVDIRSMSGDILCFLNFMVDSSKTNMNQLELANYLKLNVKDRLNEIDGVANTNMMPSKDYAMRIWMNVHKMSAMGITPAEVSAAIQAQNQQAAAGSIGASNDESLATHKVTIDGRLNKAQEFENIIVRQGQDQRTVKLGDIAKIELDAEELTGYSRLNGQDTIGMMISKTNEANALSTVKLVKERLSELEKNFPNGVSWVVGYDPTLSIEATMQEIIFTLALALLMVIFITYVFLQDWRATIIPAIAIPVSLLGAFIFIYAFGFTINVLTMFGLILVIGSLVDDAIVVVENVMRLMETENLSPFEATKKGMKQITGAVIATTLVTIAVYIPIAFYGGMLGTIYTQFAVTMCVALAISTFNALTLSPALCAMILKKPKHQVGPRKFSIFRPFNYILIKSRNLYLKGANFFVRHSFITLLTLVGIIFLNGWIYQSTKSSFLPTEDKGAVFIMIEMDKDATSTQRTNEAVKDIEERIIKIPGVQGVTAIVGFSMMGGSAENQAMCIVSLDHWDERKTPDKSIFSLQQQIQQAVSTVPQASCMVVVPPSIMGLGVTGGVSAVLKVSGNATPAELAQGVQTLCQKLRMQQDKVAMSYSMYSADTPMLHLNINREKALAMNVPIDRIFSTISNKLASSYVNDFTLDGYNFKVIIQADAIDRTIPTQLLGMYVKSNDDKMVPLSSLCNISYQMGPQSHSRFLQTMSAELTVSGTESTSSGEIMNLLEKEVQEMNESPLWKNKQIQWSLAWKDLSFEERQNDGQITMLMALAIVFAFLFLVAQYESWTTPIPVILSVSVATLGALIGIVVMNISLSIYVQLGLLMLIGLASKNAILMVEFSKVEQEQGASIESAALHGASTRFRAVLMTAISFIFGVFPMVIATGSGAASRQEIGVTTFSGMILATVLGIFIVPGLYTLFAKMRFLTKSNKTQA